MASPTPSPSRSQGAAERAVALLMPLAIFALLLPWPKPGEKAPSLPEPEPVCGAPSFRMPASCTSPHPQPCENCRALSCEVASDWVLHFEVVGLDPRCEYRVQVVEKTWDRGDVVDPWLPSVRPVACRVSAETAASAEAMRCTATLAPVRSTSIALIGDDGTGPRLVADGVRLVARDGGLDVRPEAVEPAIIVGVSAVALALLLLIVGARGLRTKATPRAPFVSNGRIAALGACGAMFTASLMGLMPADVGGFDTPSLARIPRLLLGAALAGAALAVLVHHLRASYHTRTALGRVMLVLGTIVLTLGCSFLTRRAISENASIDEGIGIKDRYYAVLGLAQILPAMMWPLRSGSPAYARPSMGLFAVIVGAALALAIGGVALVELAAPDILVQLTGFYKPISAPMFVVVSLPFIAALAVTSTSGPDRPRWLVQADVLLRASLAQSHHVDRMRHARALTTHLLRHRDALAMQRPDACAALATLAPLVVEPLALDAREREQLGASPEATSQLTRLLALLRTLAVEASRPTRRLRCPLRDQPDTFLTASVLWSPAPTSAEPPLIVTTRSGALSDESARHAHTARLVASFVARAGPGPLAGGSYLVVDLDDAGGVSTRAPYDHVDVALVVALSEIWRGDASSAAAACGRVLFDGSVGAVDIGRLPDGQAVLPDAPDLREALAGEHGPRVSWVANLDDVLNLTRTPRAA